MGMAMDYLVDMRRKNALLQAEIARLRAELAEWKERHPYGEVDLDMAIEAETKDLKLRIDTLESAQIDYEAQCAAKDAHNKEGFDKYCRNLTELAQVHKESCDAKDARIAEQTSWAIGSAAANEMLRKRIAELEKSQPTFDECMAYVARAERDEARIAELEAEQALHIEAYKSMLARAERAEAERDAAMNVVRWVETWVGQPVGAYSVYALDGLFGMTRDKIAALAPSPTVGGMEE